MKQPTVSRLLLVFSLFLQIMPLSGQSGAPVANIQLEALGPAGKVNDWARQNAQTYYVGTDAGLYKSVDGGATWAFLSNFGTRYVLQLYANTGAIFALTLEPMVLASYYSTEHFNLWRSTNGGKHWTLVRQVVRNLSYGPHGGCFEYQPFVFGAGQHLYLSSKRDCNVQGLGGSDFGFNRSSDNGTTWAQTGYNIPLPLPMNPQDWPGFQHMAGRGDTVVGYRISPFVHLQISTDGGANFTDFAPAGDAPDPIYGIGFWNGALYGIKGGVGLATLYRTSDFQNWTALSLPNIADARFFRLEGGVLYIQTDQKIYRASDLANPVFNEIYDGSQAARPLIRGFRVFDNILFVSDFAGLHLRSTDGGATWAERANTLSNSPVSFCLSNSRLMTYETQLLPTATGSNEVFNIFKLKNLVTGTWSRPDFPLQNTPRSQNEGPVVIYCHQNVLFAAPDSNVIFRSPDNGATWQSSNLPADFQRFASDGTRLYVSCRDLKLYFSDDKGATWAFLCDLPGPNDPLAVAQGSKFWTINFFSTDAGATWTPRPFNTLGFSSYDFVSPSGVYFAAKALEGSAFFHSTDNGATWQQSGYFAAAGHSQIYNGTGQPYVEFAGDLVFFIYSVSNTNLEQGTFVTADMGQHWMRLDKSIRNLKKQGDWLYGSYGGGVWRTRYSSLLSKIRVDEKAANDPHLPDFEKVASSETTVFPNPAQDAVFVNLPPDMAGPGRASLLNQLGQQVLDLDFEYLETTGSALRLDLRGLPSGQFFLKIETGHGAVFFEKLIKQ